MSGGETRTWRGGAGKTRFGERGIIVMFALLLAVLAGAAVLVAALEKPSPPRAVCPPPGVCAHPPPRVTIASGAAASRSSPLREVVTINKSAYRASYPPGSTTSDETSTGITIYLDRVTIVHIDGATNSNAPQQMVERTIAFLKQDQKVPDLHPNKEDSEREILSPALGGWAGDGGFYQGTYNSPTGVVSPANVAILAASDGRDTVGVAVIATDRNQTDGSFGRADQLILDTLRFRSGALP
jgi:hypothetical protein